MTIPELDDLREHLERFRAVTLQVLDVVSDDDLSWRPDPDSYSVGQQLLHIAQAEDFYARGLLQGEWDADRLRFPEAIPDRAGLRSYFAEVRARTLGLLSALDPEDLGRVWDVPGAPMPLSLRSWLWFVVEHEIHHKAQLSTYLRRMGLVAPFYAMPLPLGERPDHQARRDLGGF